MSSFDRFGSRGLVDNYNNELWSRGHLWAKHLLEKDEGPREPINISLGEPFELFYLGFNVAALNDCAWLSPEAQRSFPYFPKNVAGRRIRVKLVCPPSRCRTDGAAAFMNENGLKSPSASVLWLFASQVADSGDWDVSSPRFCFPAPGENRGGILVWVNGRFQIVPICGYNDHFSSDHFKILVLAED